MSPAIAERRERLQLLKLRAQALLDAHGDAWPEPLGPATANTGAPPGFEDMAQLLEELRIYQAELEVQNDELRRAQEESDIARARYQLLFDQNPLPAVVLGEQGTIEQANARADAMLGPALRQAGPDNRLYRRLAREDRTRLHVALRSGMEGSPMVLERLSLESAPGPELIVDLHLIPLSDDFHRRPHTLLLLLDRTAEAARDRERAFFSVMLDSSDSLIYAFDAEGRTLLINRAALDLLGRDSSEVMGRQREEFLPLRDAALHRDADLKVLANGQALTVEEKIHTRDGPLTLLTRKFPLLDDQGQRYGVGGISTNITELKKQQEMATLSESVFMMASEAIFITDADTRIRRVNPAFTAQTGFSQAAVLGMRAGVFRSGAKSDAKDEQIWATARQLGRWAGELVNRGADGHDYPVWSSISAIRDAQGRVSSYVAIQTDLSALHAAQSEVQRLALFDSLTGLPNRALLEDRIRLQLEHAQRHHQGFALIFADLDHFKEVNDTLGHAVGDELLRLIGQRLKRVVRSEDTVARIGGDEFVLLLPGADRADALQVADKLLTALRLPTPLGTLPEYRAMGSAGVAVYPDDGTTLDLLLRNADTAMYRAKQAGRNQATSFDAQMASDTASAFAILTELTKGLTRQELRLHFQPQFELASGRLVGAEALVRWQRPGHRLQQPGEFLGVAAHNGLLPEIDRWVLEEALRQVGAWKRAGLWKPGMRVAVNHTSHDLRHTPSMPDRLTPLLRQHGLDTSVLELEITESSLLENTAEVIERLQALRALGVTLSIDDFGTDYSSLSYLRRLPVQVIKIDQSFVREILSNHGDRVLVDTIITMAHNLGLLLVAEGVETPEQRDLLRSLGCERAQGYLLGRPVSAEEFARLHLAAPG